MSKSHLVPTLLVASLVVLNLLIWGSVWWTLHAQSQENLDIPPSPSETVSDNMPAPQSHTRSATSSSPTPTPRRSWLSFLSPSRSQGPTPTPDRQQSLHTSTSNSAPSNTPASNTAHPSDTTPEGINAAGATTPVDLEITNPSPNSAAYWNQRLAQLQSGDHIRVRITEDWVNRYNLSRNFRQNDIEVQDVHVNFEEGAISAEARVLWKGVWATVRSRAYIGVQNCVPVVQIVSLRVAGLPTPADMRKQVDAALSSAISAFKRASPVCLTQVHITPEQAIIEGTVQR